MIDFNSCVLWLDSKYFSESYWWDRSKYRNNGVVYGAKWKGDAFYFDGINDYIDCGNHESLAFTDSFSIEVWLLLPSYPSSWHKCKIVIKSLFSSSGNGFWLDIHPEEHTVRFRCYGGSGNHDGVFSSTALELNRWYHIVGVYDGAQRIFINGEEENSGSASYANPNTHLYLGRYSDSYTQMKVGLVRVYNKKLSDTEIELLYNLTHRRI